MPVFRLVDEPLFPPPELAEPDGVLAVGGDLSPVRLLTAYAQGIFPWYAEGDPLLWWSPAPRLVLLPAEFHLPRRLRRTNNSLCVLIFTDVPGRVDKQLLDLANRFGTPDPRFHRKVSGNARI